MFTSDGTLREASNRSLSYFTASKDLFTSY